MIKHLNLARIQAFSKRSICICLEPANCNRWIFHLCWERSRYWDQRSGLGRKIGTGHWWEGEQLKPAAVRCQDVEITGVGSWRTMEEVGWKWLVWRDKTKNCSLRGPAPRSEIWVGAGASRQGKQTWCKAGSRARAATASRRQVREWKVFVKLGGTCCPSRY